MCILETVRQTGKQKFEKMGTGLLLSREKENPQCVFLVTGSDHAVRDVRPLGAFYSAVSVRFPFPALVCHLLLWLLHLPWKQLALRDGVRIGPCAHDDRANRFPLASLGNDGKKG